MTTAWFKQGFFRGISIEDYAADPCPSPSLDTRVALALRDKSPRHARHAHPRYNADMLSAYGRAMDIGTAFHSLVLEGKDIVEDIPYEKYTTNDAKFARDMAREQGMIPLLMKDFDKYHGMIDAFRAQGGFEIIGADGDPELSGFFEIDGTWYRTRPDRTYLDGATARVISLKTVTGSASRDDVERRLHRDGWDVQAGLHALGIETIYQREARVEWLVVEQDPPYGMALWPFANPHLYLAQRHVHQLGRAWGSHVRSGRWPSYSLHPGEESIGYRKYDADTIRIRVGIDAPRDA